VTAAQNTLIAKAVRDVVHRHDRHFFNDLIHRFPRSMGNVIAGRYCDLHGRSRRDANLFLLRTAERAGDGAITLAASDSELVDYANSRAARFRRYRLEGFDLEQMRDEVKRDGYAVPEGPEITDHGTVARFCDPLWWRRAIRKKQGREVEGVAIDLCLVHKKRSTPYASNDTVTRRKSQKTRNRRMLEELLAVNELGDEFTLAELSDLSVSNPVIRRGELMTRIAGFEALANEAGHVAEFYTVTTPSRFHRMHAGGQQNDKYEGATPREAAQYLGALWARARAALLRAGVRPYGFRVAEPHHDGTPHWHMLLFMPAEHRDTARDILRRYALQDTPNEPGASLHRFKAEAIDPRRGSAAGYIAKYIAKNIDGFGLENEQQQHLFDHDPQGTAERVDAWASTWGIRQFQQIGGPPVTVWRELRRMDGEGGEVAGPVKLGPLEAARVCADRGDWAGFCRAMGGIEAGGGQHPIKITRLQEINTETGELPLNRYGEPAAGRVVGVEAGNVIHVTRWHEWRVERGEARGLQGLSAQENEGHVFGVHGEGRLSGLVGDHAERGAREMGSGGAVLDFQGGGAAVAPWSSVNNCTGVGSGGSEREGPPPGPEGGKHASG
jgi:hypothetical protein